MMAASVAVSLLSVIYGSCFLVANGCRDFRLKKLSSRILDFKCAFGTVTTIIS